MHDCFVDVPRSETQLTAAETAWQQPREHLRRRTGRTAPRESGAWRKSDVDVRMMAILNKKTVINAGLATPPMPPV